jgi:hypothetical protein
MAETDIQFPAVHDEVIPDAQLRPGPVVDQEPPPVEEPAVPPSVASQDTQNEAMAVYIY